jgi:tetratricopeptide (TPR) repeat protein
MPLAIEMAAAQIAYLGVSGVAARLTDRFALLSSGDRAAARHQQTLRATLDWSYNLLSAEEQQVLEDLSVFAGGCTEAAARSVAGADEGVLLQLVRKSLVMSIPSRGDAQPRYRLLQSIQAYALAKLQARGASQATYRRHLAHYLALVQEPVEFAGPRVDAWILRITPEFDNIRAAFAHALIQPDGGGAAMRIANGMTIYSFNCGYGLEIAAWAEQAWMHDVRPSEYECAIGALAMAYRCILMLSQREEAMKFCELALPVLQDAGDLVNTMFCLEMLANNVGDQRAQNYAERLLPLAIQHQSHDMESRAYRALGFAAQMRGETSVAAMCFEKAIKRAPWDATVCYALLYKVDPAHAVRLCEQAFDRVGHDSQPRYVAAMLEAFGYMLADMGEWASAHRMFERYVRSMQLDRAGSGMDLAVMNQSVPVDLTLISGLELLTFDTGIAIMTMGILEQIAGRFDSALVRYNQAQMLSRHTGFQWACDFCELLKIGVSKNSHAVGALSQTQDCLFTVSQAGTDLYTVPALMQVAIELGLRGDLEHACLLGGAADAAAKTTTNVCSCFLVAPILWSKHAQQPKIAKMRQQALTLLGTEAYGEICARGAQMDLPQAVAIALKAR